MGDWDDACAFALTLPGVAMESWWGSPCPKINGKGLMSPGREPGSFGLMVTQPEKELLFETDPDTFWQTSHYANYPMLLVRYGTGSRERIELYIQRAWWSDPHLLLARYDDHATDAILSAAWLRTAASQPELWSPSALTPQLAATEGWTFGVA